MDLQGLELPERVNMGKLRKYHDRIQEPKCNAPAVESQENTEEEKDPEESTKGVRPGR